MILMLRFQRKKMTKALYPGLLRRLAYRLIVKAVAAVKVPRAAAPVQDVYSSFQVQPPAPKEPATIRRLPYVRSAQLKKMKRNPSKGQSL